MAEHKEEELFRVVVNAERQYSIWPVYKENPIGMPPLSSFLPHPTHATPHTLNGNTEFCACLPLIVNHQPILTPLLVAAHVRGHRRLGG